MVCTLAGNTLRGLIKFLVLALIVKKTFVAVKKWIIAEQKLFKG